MDLPISKLKLTRHGKTIPDLSKRDFNDLKRSIEKWGIIEPIIINQNNMIVCGRERYRAALVLGIKEVPVVIRKTNGASDSKEISLEENLRRRHLDSSIKSKEKKNLANKNKVRAREKNDQTDNPERHFSGHYLSAKLIPELSKLLDEGTINLESASVYANESLEKQKMIYDIVMDDFNNGSSLKNKKSIY
jgi:ParB family chromosome partitioning protein